MAVQRLSRSRRLPATRIGWQTMALAAAMIVFACLYLYLLRDVGLSTDEWTWLLYLVHPTHGTLYSGPNVDFLSTVTFPYNNQPIVVEVLLYRLWADVFGVAHHWVPRVFLLWLHLTAVGLVFVLARRRVVESAALAVAVLVLIMGRAWETLLFPGSMTFVLPMVAACVAWTVLDDPADRRGLALAAIVLAIASVSGSVAAAVLAGVAVEIVARRWWRLLWIPLAGAAPFVAWYVKEHSHLSLGLSYNLPHVPWWGVKFIASAAGAAVGLPPAGGAAVLVIAVVAIAVWRRSAHVGPPVSPRAIGLASTLLFVVLATGAGRAANTPASSSRYMYVPAVVLLLLACECTAGLTVKVTRRGAAAIAGAVVVAAAAVLGEQQFRHGKVVYRQLADRTAALMGAMRIVGAPSLEVEPSAVAYTPGTIDAFVRNYGAAPLDTQAQIADALPQTRAAVDAMLIRADVALRPEPVVRSRCASLAPDGTLPPGPVAVNVATNRVIALRLIRYADPAGATATPLRPPGITFTVKRDPLTRPWRLLLPAGTRALVCPERR